MPTATETVATPTTATATGTGTFSGTFTGSRVGRGPFGCGWRGARGRTSGITRGRDSTRRCWSGCCVPWARARAPPRPGGVAVRARVAVMLFGSRQSRSWLRLAGGRVWQEKRGGQRGRRGRERGAARPVAPGNESTWPWQTRRWRWQRRRRRQRGKHRRTLWCFSIQTLASATRGRFLWMCGREVRMNDMMGWWMARGGTRWWMLRCMSWRFG